MRQILHFDPERCLACRSCELACAVAHSRAGTLLGALSESPAPLRRVRLAAGAQGLEALRCAQCAEPLCAFACKSGAIFRDPESGQVTLDEERCLGCWMCVMVCPQGIRPDAAAGLARRCDACLLRPEPACVEACPTGALERREKGIPRQDSGFAGRLVVVGASAAAVAACEAARELAPRASISLVTAEPQRAVGLIWRPQNMMPAHLVQPLGRTRRPGGT